MTKPSERAENWLNAHTGLVAAAVVLVGLLLRWHRAADFYLNPDEAWMYLIGSQKGWQGLWDFYHSDVGHPPLSILILHGILRFAQSELALRLPSVLAGALFPWIVMRVVTSMAGAAAGLGALLVLTFSPTLTGLSAEVRPYALAIFFVSASLAALLRSLDRGSVRWMLGFHLCLYLAILSDYSVVWMVGATGVYALVRLWRGPASTSIRVAWVIGQAGAFGLYLTFLATAGSFSNNEIARKGIVEGWLWGAFPHSSEPLAIFPLKASLRQFKYLMGNEVLAFLVAAVFLLGLYSLWKKRDTVPLILLILPFLLASAGAMLYLFPFGATRHSSVMGIVIAAGVGQGLATLCRGKSLPIAAAALVLIPIWVKTAPTNSMVLDDRRHGLQQMREAVEYLRVHAAPGSAVITDRGTDFILAYYLGSRDYSVAGEANTPPYRVRESGGLRILSVRRFQFQDEADLRSSVSEVRREYELNGPVWVAAGGFGIGVKTSFCAGAPIQFSHHHLHQPGAGSGRCVSLAWLLSASTNPAQSRQK